MSKELVAIVDEQDRVIGTKPRDELTPDDIVRVSVLWIENSKGEVLLQQRSLTKKVSPGQWGPAAAGTVESHETYLDNIIKEAEEELGLTDFTPVEVGKRLAKELDGNFGRIFTFFKTVSDKDVRAFTLQADEVAQIKWVAKTSILEDVAKHPKRYVPSAIFWQAMYY